MATTGHSDEPFALGAGADSPVGDLCSVKFSECSCPVTLTLNSEFFPPSALNDCADSCLGGTYCFPADVLRKENGS